MYGRGGNQIVEPHGVGAVGGGKTTFICTEDVERGGRKVRCGKRIDGSRCEDEHLHLKRGTSGRS